ncbi:hypothetical protein ONZ51_g2480 [Trametes cubensis]|uniref:Uncharacterized protein n=1 Tax=Trametes cubensis TaxID=1111947 RepID=A0AAD7U0L7_9APHY|nr:hypothetical protein ONZ51_g2480 [Trametes cubensis]
MDIIANIFDHLIPDSRGSLLLPTSCPEQTESKLCAQALAASAQACRAFEGPALDRLWEVVDNVKNLLSILPSYSAANGIHTSLYIGEHEWIRFRAYSSRVRVLDATRNLFNNTAGFAAHPDLPDPIWTILLHQSSRSPLFPHLTHLTVESDLAMLMVLLRPPVTQLHLMPPYSDEGVLHSHAIDVVRPHLPHIQDIWISNALLRHGDLCDHLGLSTLTHVRSITIDIAFSATPALISAFMDFPHLRKLSLDCTFSPPDLASLVELKSKRGFFELRELWLAADHGVVAKFLEATDPPRLHRFGCTLSLKSTLEDDPLGVGKIVSRLPPALRCFYLTLSQSSTGRFGMPPNADPQAPSPSALLFLPPELRAMEEIREVDVCVEHLEIPFDEDDLRALCKAWPHLTRFSFEHSQPSARWGSRGESRIRDAPVPTLSSLLAFTEAHPHLTELTLPGLDTTALRADELGLFRPGGLRAISPHPLRVFRLSAIAGDAPIVKLATVLDRAFPVLDLDALAVASLRMLDRFMQAPHTLQNYYRAQAPGMSNMDGPHLLVVLLSTLRAARSYNDWTHGPMKTSC